MAVSLIGTVHGNAANGGDVALALPAMQFGDVVYLFGGHGENTGLVGPAQAGWTQLTLLVVPTGAAYFGVWRKVMGTTPDTSVTGRGNGNGADATAYAAYCFRGVDIGTPEDATTTTATGIGQPDGASITTVKDNAWVLSLWGAARVDAAVTNPSGYTNQLGDTVSDSVAYCTYGALKTVSPAGAENPGAWSNFTGGGFAIATVALRPGDEHVNFNQSKLALAC